MPELFGNPLAPPGAFLGTLGCLGVTPTRGPRGEGGVGGIRRAAGTWPTRRGTLGCSPVPFPHPAASQPLEPLPGAAVLGLHAANGPAGAGVGGTLWGPKALLFHEGAAQPQPPLSPVPERTRQRCREPGGGTAAPSPPAPVPQQPSPCRSCLQRLRQAHRQRPPGDGRGLSGHQR